LKILYLRIVRVRVFIFVIMNYRELVFHKWCMENLVKFLNILNWNAWLLVLELYVFCFVIYFKYCIRESTIWLKILGCKGRLFHKEYQTDQTDSPNKSSTRINTLVPKTKFPKYIFSCYCKSITARAINLCWHSVRQVSVLKPFYSIYEMFNQ